MSLAGQLIQPHRYTIIPRTLSFLMHNEKVLLLRLPDEHEVWGGYYNGVGGHIEQGEDPLNAARREIQEETGIIPQALTLCGVVIVDTGEQPGIGLYIFIGDTDNEIPRISPEGIPTWVALDALEDVPLVEDLPRLLPRAIASYKDLPPFSAIYSFNSAGNLSIEIAS